MSNYSPKRATETETFTVDFAPLLPAGVTIASAVWSNVAVAGDDPNASAMISGAASVTGSKVSQRITGGLIGVTYAPICTALTSDGQTLVLPEFGVGYLYIPG